MQKVNQPRKFTRSKCLDYESANKKAKQITREHSYKGEDVFTNRDNYS